MGSLRTALSRPQMSSMGSKSGCPGAAQDGNETVVCSSSSTGTGDSIGGFIVGTLLVGGITDVKSLH